MKPVYELWVENPENAVKTSICRPYPNLRAATFAAEAVRSASEDHVKVYIKVIF